jgi:chromosome segregation ATPase
LEKRATDIEAAIEEAAADSAEELKAIRQDIKQLDETMRASFDGIGDTFIGFGDTMATKEDLRNDLSAMEGRINNNITQMKEDLLDAIKQLWQQRPSE